MEADSVTNLRDEHELLKLIELELQLHILNSWLQTRRKKKFRTAYERKIELSNGVNKVCETPVTAFGEYLQ